MGWYQGCLGVPWAVYGIVRFDYLVRARWVLADGCFHPISVHFAHLGGVLVKRNKKIRTATYRMERATFVKMLHRTH